MWKLLVGTRLGARRLVAILTVGALGVAGRASAYTPAQIQEMVDPFPGAYGHGYCVASAGDWNGDGYPDLIVGFHEDDATIPGYAALYLGGPAPTKALYKLFTGENIGDRFGAAVAGAGDFNGDGYDDIMIGAPGYDTNEPDAGAVYVFFGGKNADTAYDLKIAPDVTSGYTGVNLGFAVVGIGDLNQDGFDDILAGAPDGGAGGQGLGKAYVYNGGDAPDDVADAYLIGAGEDHFGWSLASGDVNGDGYKDMIVGAPFDPFQFSNGQIHVYLGGPLFSPPLAQRIVGGENLNDHFGVSVAAGGDLNGDGYGDYLVGAEYNSTGGNHAGRVYAFFGGPSLDDVPDLTLTGAAAGDDFGAAVAFAGNFDGDQDDEMLVGAPYNGSGRIYGFFGGPTVDTIPDIEIPAPAGGGQFGTALAGLGDYNGDQLDDFAAGFYGFDGGRGKALVYGGKSFVFKFPKPGQQVYMEDPVIIVWDGMERAGMDYSGDGGQTWTRILSDIGGGQENRVSVRLPAVQTQHARLRLVALGQNPGLLNSEQIRGDFRVVAAVQPPEPDVRRGMVTEGQVAGDFLGASTAPAGDVNGDGFDDMIVGAQLSDAGGPDAGAAWIYFGGPAADDVADVMLLGEAPGDEFGTSVAGAGDVNGDGFDDVLVGAPHNAGGGPDAGRVYLFLGGAMMDATPDHEFSGSEPSGTFGHNLAGGGDWNGDGYPDLLVGDFQGMGGIGLVHVFLGGPGMDETEDLLLSGENPGDSFGGGLAFAGDADGDGFDDVLVGAPGSDAGGNAAGQAYLFLGGPSFDATPDLVMTGKADDDEFGFSAGSVDFNGDGFQDLVVGSPYNNSAGTLAGQAYVFYGGPGLDGDEDVTLTGTEAEGQLGWAVGSARDTNGDGFEDLIVGVPGSNAPFPHAGRVLLFFGGPGADGTPDRVLSGEAPEDYFGYAVASAGDRRGDGFEDVVVGAPARSMFGPYAGAVYIFDTNRYAILSPLESEIWNVGSERSVSWMGSVRADLWLSVDGGNRYALLRQNVGGQEMNAVSLTVPHQPTRFAKVRLTPHDTSIWGQAESESLFTIQASIALLNLSAEPAPGGGVLLSWQTDPGPEDLAGYKLERTPSGVERWDVVSGLIRGTSYQDAAGGPGMRYRLSGVNGLGEDLVLGETAMTPRAALSAWPLPYRGGPLTVSFLTASGLGGRPAPVEVSVFDLQGRRVRQLVKDDYDAGTQTLVWDGLDEAGRPVTGGIYFIRAASAGEATRLKLVVVR